MILVNSLRYHLFSLLQRHKENAKTFNLPLLFLRVWRLEEIQTLPFPREIFLPPCPQDTIPSQACIFDLLVLHSPGRVTGLLASRNSTMLMGTGTVTRVSQSYPLKHIGRLITRDRKAARAITVFLFSPSSPPIPTAILHVFYCSPKNDFVWESFQRFSKKSVHGSAFIFRKRVKREKSVLFFFKALCITKSIPKSLVSWIICRKVVKRWMFFQKYFPPWNDFQKVKFMVHVLFNFRYGN